jgi:transcriptional regulator with XRE-family HTH domain
MRAFMSVGIPVTFGRESSGEAALAHWAEVAAVVNEQMAARGLSQRELAERSGLSAATLRKIQHGDAQARNRSTLTALSRALGLGDDHLWLVFAGLPGGDGGRDLGAEVDELRQRVAAIEEQLAMPPGEAG